MGKQDNISYPHHCIFTTSVCDSVLLLYCSFSD